MQIKSSSVTCNSDLDAKDILLKQTCVLLLLLLKQRFDYYLENYLSKSSEVTLLRTTPCKSHLVLILTIISR